MKTKTIKAPKPSNKKAKQALKTVNSAQLKNLLSVWSDRAEVLDDAGNHHVAGAYDKCMEELKKAMGLPVSTWQRAHTE